jgi:tetratricopeptide (TPR) repeat protein
VDIIENLLKLIESGKDSALARFGVGNEFLRREQAADAVIHLAIAVKLDPDYSAAWKLLGKSHLALGNIHEAIAAWEAGIAAATARGDKQAVREMEVFTKRARKALDNGPANSA